MPRVVYTPYQQSGELGEMTVYLRATPTAAGALPALARQAVQRADRTLPVFGMTTMAATVDNSLAVERMLARLSTLFGALATMLAAIGLYGLMSYSVARRTREIGIRIALGAGRPEVLGLVLRDVAVLTAIGIAVGLPGAYAIGRAAEAQLFGLSPARSVVARPGRRGAGRREPGRRLPPGASGRGDAAAPGAALRVVVTGSVTVTFRRVAGAPRDADSERGTIGTVTDPVTIRRCRRRTLFGDAGCPDGAVAGRGADRHAGPRASRSRSRPGARAIVKDLRYELSLNRATRPEAAAHRDR